MKSKSTKKKLEFLGKTYLMVEPEQYGSCRGCVFDGQYCPQYAGVHDCNLPTEIIFVSKQTPIKEST